MDKNLIFDILIFIILIIGYMYIEDSNFFIKLIYRFFHLYHMYICVVVFIENFANNKTKIKIFLIVSVQLYFFTYFFVFDTNPFFVLIFYYLFFPYFWKSILIVFIHSFILSKFSKKENIYKPIDNNLDNNEDISLKRENYNSEKTHKIIYTNNYYFLLGFFNFIAKNKKRFFIFFICFILLIIIDFKLFINRIKLWVHFNGKSKTLPKMSSSNTTFYITATLVNVENIIRDYIKEMIKLINYLGKENIIISIVENNDSYDNTTIYLEEFKNYLDEQKIINKFYFDHDIVDSREDKLLFMEHDEGYMRIKFLSQLRNKCLEFLYDIPNLNFSNIKILFFNDIIFEYENIINLLSTNNEDYDAVCGLDFYDIFYDSWVSIDLSGYSLRHDFPFFVNKEGQDLVINHKPIRVFSCWNGVMAFTAEPLKDKKIQFRYELHEDRIVEHYLDSDQKFSYESECTYFHIDLFSLGYTKTFINPDVRVAYLYEYYSIEKDGYIKFKDFKMYFKYYFDSIFKERNKNMSNNKDRNITLSKLLWDWYMENRKENEINHKLPPTLIEEEER